MSWSPTQIENVWNKGKIVPQNDPRSVRQDVCGAWIVRSEHGNINSEYGWQIDHIQPVSANGSDDISNLQPLQWENNVRKSDGSLSCPIVADGIHNRRRF